MVFVDPDTSSNIIMARAYDLDSAYTDDMAVFLCEQALPKSTRVEPNAEEITVGDRHMAVIRGTLDAGPMEFYLFGSGSRAIAVMFTGDKAVEMAERVLLSVSFK